MRPLLPLLMLITASAPAGEILDRIAVVAGDQVITQSAIKRQIRLAAFMRNEKPDYSPESMRGAADRLIRQGFVRREIELSRYAPPGMDEVEKQIESNLGARGPEFLRRLEAAGFTDADLKEAFLAMVSFNRFVSFRFNPGVIVSEAEIREFYEKEYVPARLKSSPDLPVEPMEKLQAGIVRLIETRKANAALDVWLEQARQQIHIQYFEEVFK